jgi:hypothetical protein
MPPTLEEHVKDRVWRLWLSGDTRKKIAEICEIGAGSVTNIIIEKTKGLDSSEYGAIRDLAVQLKKEDLTFAQLASMFRRHNYIERLGANEEQIESLIANLLDGARSLPQDKIVDFVNMLFELSKSESIPLTEVPAYINQKIKEQKKIEEEIQKGRAILDQENIDIQTIEEYKRLKEELKKYGLGPPNKLVSVLQSFSEMGYDSEKIITTYVRIKSLRQTVRNLSKGCRILESRAARYEEILPLCEQIDSFGMGFPELVVFRSAVLRVAEMENLSYGDAAYVLMSRIDTQGKVAYMEKQLNDTMTKIQVVNIVSASQNEAMMAVARLQFQGITENQIVNACRRIVLYHLTPLLDNFLSHISRSGIVNDQQPFDIEIDLETF